MTVKNLARTYSAELDGITAKLIEVEIDMNVGLHSFNIVGLADRSLSEAKERVNSALKNSGAKPPNRENRKITVNLAPADVKKTGSNYDLAIALGYLRASKQISAFDSACTLFVGELALDGRLRPINGALNIAELALANHFSRLFLPSENMFEARAIKGIEIVPLETLSDAIAILEHRTTNTAATTKEVRKVHDDKNPAPSAFPDMGEIIGQENAKRALTIAAAGNHNLLFVGPPGVGKSMLARALAGILPTITHAEAIEVTKIWSAAGLSPGKLMSERPFRAPHQTISATALIGGGQDPKPGEISLAHRGVLFLDELPEFQSNALEALREPLESGVVRVARARQSAVFPARFALIAAMNPCPCGFYGDAERECKCTAYEVIKYQKKISGPLLDRIDMQIRVGRVKVIDLNGKEGDALISSSIKERVEAARAKQGSRTALTNAELTSREAQRAVRLDRDGEKFLETLDRSRISPRSYYRVLKVARTIADLENVEQVSKEHLAEAFSYRLREEN